MSASLLPDDLIKKMQATLQNPDYHAEGDVLAHSEMVLSQFHSFKSKFELSKEDETILSAAALLHDIGKTETTKLIGGVWRAPGHEIAGVPIARNILLSQNEISSEQRRAILDIVRWHYFPFWWMRKSKNENELRLIATRLDLRLLSIFSILDLSGRKSKDLETSVALMWEFYSQFAAKVTYEWGEYKAIQDRFRQWSVKMKNAAWSSFNIKNATLLGRLMDQNAVGDSPPVSKNVHIMIGPAYSGKSTYLAKNFPGAFVVNLDQFMIGDHFEADSFSLDRRVTEFGYLLSIYLSHHTDVFIEGRILNEFILERLNRTLRRQNVRIKYYIFESRLDDILERAKKLETAMPGAMIRSHYNQLMEPHPWEAHDITWVES